MKDLKILALVKTRDEIANIDLFCEAYAWTDGILVADGGSTDKTIEEAQKYNNVSVKEFGWRFYSGEVWTNPSGLMTNFLLDWAEEEGADWVIFDDCDCHPNYKLRENAMHFINIAEKEGYIVINAHRLYIYGYDKYFPRMNREQSLWAWKLNSGIRGSDEKIVHPGMQNIPPISAQLAIDYPYVLLHYAWPTEDVVNKKLNFYRIIGNPATKHPLDYGGKLAPLPDYARRER